LPQIVSEKVPLRAAVIHDKHAPRGLAGGGLIFGHLRDAHRSHHYSFRGKDRMGSVYIL
jgi:hypothetical protein